MIKLSHTDVLEAFRSLAIKEQLLFMQEVHTGLPGKTPYGHSITARTRREMRRFICEQDPKVMQWMRGFEPDEVLYEIGANCGGLVLAAAALHKQITIVAIEPSYASYESLARNVTLNNLANVIPLQIALLDRTGILSMNYRDTAPGTSLHGVGTNVDQVGKSFEPVAVQQMPTYKLDDLIAFLRLPRPTRLLIDVDGYEEAVLRGGMGTLTGGTVRDLVVEIVNHDGVGTRVAAIAALLDSAGFRRVEAFEHEATGGRAHSIVADYHFVRAGVPSTVSSITSAAAVGADAEATQL